MSDDLSRLLDAEVQSVVYHNKENGYTIARVRSKNEPGQVSIVGILGEIVAGSTLDLHGKWTVHPKFGRQFEVRTFEEARPATENGVIRFLQSSIKGVGEKTATRLVEEFGVAVLDILDDDPEMLLKIKGISKKNWLILSIHGVASGKSRICWFFSKPITYPPRLPEKFFIFTVRRLNASCVIIRMILPMKSVA